jgi:hypothetical protein
LDIDIYSQPSPFHIWCCPASSTCDVDQGQSQGQDQDQDIWLPRPRQREKKETQRENPSIRFYHTDFTKKLRPATFSMLRFPT